MLYSLNYEEHTSIMSIGDRFLPVQGLQSLRHNIPVAMLMLLKRYRALCNTVTSIYDYVCLLF
jgi:hypothetical protein